MVYLVYHLYGRWFLATSLLPRLHSPVQAPLNHKTWHVNMFLSIEFWILLSPLILSEISFSSYSKYAGRHFVGRNHRVYFVWLWMCMFWKVSTNCLHSLHISRQYASRANSKSPSDPTNTRSQILLKSSLVISNMIWQSQKNVLLKGQELFSKQKYTLTKLINTIQAKESG